MLGLTTEYQDRFDHFRLRVLDRAQQELAGTDLPFTYELLKEGGRAVTAIRFLFAPLPNPLPAAAASGWEAALLAVGVSRSSLPKIKLHLTNGYYDEGYVRYVLACIREQVQRGQVQKEAGAVFKALTDGYLLTDYQQLLATPAAARPGAGTLPGKRQPAAVLLQREKLQNELNDLCNTLKFVQFEAPESTYPGAQRQKTVAEIKHKIAGLSRQLTGLS